MTSSLGWFAVHETRLAWREFLGLMTAGNRWRVRSALFGFGGFVLFLHLIAYFTVSPYAGISTNPPRETLVMLGSTILLSWAVMLAEAVEAVTRSLYARGDLDLLLSSPIAPWRPFAVRLAALVLPIGLMSTALAAPFINVLAFRGGAHWFAGYALLAAMAMSAVAFAVLIALTLFRLFGPKRTRLIAQILAAIIGAAFVIGLQLGAISSYGTLSRTQFLQSDTWQRWAPDSSSILWWPALAVLGNMTALAAVMGASLLLLAGVIAVFAPRLPTYLREAAGVARGGNARQHRSLSFRAMSQSRVLRNKEWILLWRDPWLLSQSLMQLLYLVPPAFMLWRSFAKGTGAPILLLPVLVMAAGQLAGGLAWLAISGEDAPELIATAPVRPVRVLRAKIEAVLGGVGLIFSPFIAAFACVSPWAALVAVIGILLAAGSSSAIQLWFRSQAKRSHFRRRQVSSRFATIAEAFSSIIWAATAALAGAQTWFAAAPAVLAMGVLAGTWAISPARAGADIAKR